MIKVIAGKYRSRILLTPAQETIPSKSIVRTSLANALMDKTNGASVLDLFAGSGALGIEELSRGAAHCVFGDKSPEAVNVIAQNLAALKETQGEVVQGDFAGVLEKLSGRHFDIVLLDPPYAMKEVYAQVPAYLLDRDLLNPGAAVVLEYEGEVEAPRARFASFKEYTYGRTHVLILRR
jgi:16S rRNA (guanine966-N2)-methyltransferase